MTTRFLILTCLLAFIAAQSSNLIVSVPYEYTYYLNNGYNAELQVPEGANIAAIVSTFVNSTTGLNETIAPIFEAAASAPFISFSDEFTQLIGETPNVQLVEDRPGEYFAFEGTAWIPSRNEVWFTSSLYSPPGRLYILHLSNLTITEPPLPPEYFNWQRCVYSQTDDLVYVTSYRDNSTYRGGLFTINPETYEIIPIFNAFFGFPFNGLNDLTFVGTNESRYLFVSDVYFMPFAYPEGTPPQLSNTGMYRWDLQHQILLPALSLTTQPGLNAIKIGPDLKTLYVGDTFAPYSQTPASQVIFKYDIDDDFMPVNRRVFAVPRYFLDGFQVDDQGRVWSCEGDGIVVRNSHGVILGIINRLYFGRDLAFGTLGLAGNTVIVLAVDRLWTVTLTEQVVSKTSAHIFL